MAIRWHAVIGLVLQFVSLSGVSLMAAVEIDANIGIQFVDCRINLGNDGVGMYVGEGRSVSVEGSLFFGDGSPVLVDGAEQFSFEGNTWLSQNSPVELEVGRVTVNYTPDLIAQMVGRIADRHIYG